MPFRAMGRPRPREASGLNPLMRNRKMRGAGQPDASVTPWKMASGAMGARKASLMARAGAARSMRQKPGGAM